MNFEPLNPPRFDYVDAKITKEPDWRRVCISLADSHLAFIQCLKNSTKSPSLIEQCEKAEEWVSNLISVAEIKGSMK